MIKRRLVAVYVVWAVFVILGAVSPAFAGGSHAVSVEKGTAGPCVLGRTLPRGLQSERSESGLFRTPRGGLVCRVEGRRVVEIQITSPLYYTEHTLRVGTSTLTNVVQAHGRPASSRRDREDGWLILEYPALRAYFPLADQASEQRSVELQRLDLIGAGP